MSNESEKPKMPRCEGHRRTGGAFTFGPVRWVQCENDAIVLISVKQPTGDVEDSPACAQCWQESISNKAEITSVKPAEPVKPEPATK